MHVKVEWGNINFFFFALTTNYIATTSPLPVCHCILQNECIIATTKAATQTNHLINAKIKREKGGLGGHFAPNCI